MLAYFKTIVFFASKLAHLVTFRDLLSFERFTHISHDSLC